MNWLLLSVMVGCTVLGDVLQTIEMKRLGELQEAHTLFSALIRRKYLILAVGFMAVSFFAFMKLLSIADLSFAVPASAGTVVLETALAKLVLKEHVGILRWTGAGLVACGVTLLAL